MMPRLGLIFAFSMTLIAGPAMAQAVDPFDYPPKVRMPTQEEVSQVSRSVQEARAAYATGDLDQAATQYLLILELLDRTFGQYHPFTLEVSANYAVVQSSAGRYETARPIQELAARGLMDYYGEDDPRARTILGALATTYREMGETDRAVRILLWMVNKDLDNPAMNPAETLPQLLDLAGVLVWAGRHEEAQPFLTVSEQAYAELGRVEPRFERRISALSGDIHTAQGRLVEAEAAYRRALASDVDGDETGLGPQITLQTMQSLAGVLTRTRQRRAALETYREMSALLTQRAGMEGRGRTEVNAFASVFRGLVRSAWSVGAAPRT